MNLTSASVSRTISDQFYWLSTIFLTFPVFVKNCSQYITVTTGFLVLEIFFEDGCPLLEIFFEVWCPVLGIFFEVGCPELEIFFEVQITPDRLF